MTSLAYRSWRRVALTAWSLAAACAPAVRIDSIAATHAHGGPSCASGQAAVRDELALLTSGGAARRLEIAVTYTLAVENMLIACAAEATTMSTTLADDLRIQSFFIRKDLSRLANADSSAMRELLPSHGRRVARFVSTYGAMHGKPPRPE